MADKTVKIQIRYSRKAFFNKTIEVLEEHADRALELDGDVLSMTNDTEDDFHFITEKLTDTDDIEYYEDEIDDLTVLECEE
jgi:hypothetical protein